MDQGNQTSLIEDGETLQKTKLIRRHLFNMERSYNKQR